MKNREIETQRAMQREANQRRLRILAYIGLALLTIVTAVVVYLAVSRPGGVVSFGGVPVVEAR